MSVEFSRSWVELFRQIDDFDDFDLRESEGERPDDREWWSAHQEKIDFFFSALQELNFGYFEPGHTKGNVSFYTRKEFKRFLLKKWEPLVLDI